MSASSPAVPRGPTRPQSHWLLILGLVGLDYFSTLGYQPSIAFQAAGLLTPLATLVLVAVTLFGALPVYAHIASRSPTGQGSIGLLERLIPGWRGKTLILVLLGFVATDFVFTRTFSAADAAVHLVRNPGREWQSVLDFCFRAGNAAGPMLYSPLWQQVRGLWNRQMVVTLLVLVLGFTFWAVFRRGFTRRVIQLAVGVSVLYLLLNAIVIGSGLYYLATHWDLLESWRAAVVRGDWQLSAPPPVAGSGWGAVMLVCLLLLPKMALGFSGFEMSMVVMPLVRGEPSDTPERPRGRVRNTRKLLVTAAGIMAVYLIGSAFVTTILIPSEALARGGAAEDRALAYLAHGGALTDGATAHELNPLFGGGFGTLYDFSTVFILSLAGASVTMGLRDLVPPYLHRLGMELHWAHAVGAILHVFNLIKLVVTVLFHADVGAQRGAYATSVLMLFTSAAVATVIDRWPTGRKAGWRRRPYGFILIALVFGVTTVGVIVRNPNGIEIASASILAILVLSMISRTIRTTELRFGGFQFADESSRFLWESMKYLEFPALVPHCPGHRSLAGKELEIRHRHHLGPDVPLVFLEAELGDPSEFFQLPLLEVRQEKGRFLLRITRCASIPHAIAAAALELSRAGKPPEIHFGWSNERPLAANFNFVLFGQGNVPWMVRELIRKAEPRAGHQPAVIIG